MKTAVITGGNSRVGKATAIALSTLGYRVIIHGRDTAKTAQALTEVNAHSPDKNADAVTGDMSTVAGIKKVAADIQKLTDVIDVLVPYW